MLNNINENNINNSSFYGEQNKCFDYSLNTKELEQKTSEEAFGKKEFVNSEDNINSKKLKFFDNKSINFEYNSIKNLNKLNQNFNIYGEKNLIFKVNFRNTHSGNDKDNLKQMIIRHFVKFFIQFINYIVNAKINKDIKFEISYKFKPQIKFEDIVESTVEKILSFATLNVLNEEVTKEEVIQKYRNKINSLLGEFYHKNAIDIFRDIYAKDIRNETDKTINLSYYGIDGIFRLNENISTYESLRGKFKNNIIKIKLLDKIVHSMKNPPKKSLFVIKKKSK